MLTVLTADSRRDKNGRKWVVKEMLTGSLSHFPAATAPFPKSCPSYFRFARFNTSPLYYLRAWHRLTLTQTHQSANQSAYLSYFTQQIIKCCSHMRVSMAKGWWLLYRLKFWLSYGYRLILFQLRLTKKLKINFFCFKELNINKPVFFVSSKQNKGLRIISV